MGVEPFVLFLQLLGIGSVVFLGWLVWYNVSRFNAKNRRVRFDNDCV